MAIGLMRECLQLSVTHTVAALSWNKREPTSKELWNVHQEVWRIIPEDHLEKLCKKVWAALKTKGGQNKY